MTKSNLFGNIALIVLMGATTGCDKKFADCSDIGGLDCDHQGRGRNGTNGTNGTDGAQGATGATGATGETGAEGAPGQDGVDGTNGTNGSDGVDGEPGAQGEPGADGEQGPAGADGVDGADGEQGPAGPECGIAETFPTYCGFGVCRTDGTITCVSGMLETDCTPRAATGDDTDCDGVDDDCDNAVDNHYVATVTNCGVGQCASTGTKTCTAGHESDSCTPRAASVEVFNGLDDDCDGAVDNGFTCTPGATLACGAVTNVGECSIGTQSCVLVAGGGTAWSACSGSVGPATETCDGLDNDCDGAVDNGFNVGATCDNGLLGACRRTGVYQCSSATTTACNAPSASPTSEVCGNGVDEDCNGSDLACPAAPILDIAVSDPASTQVSLQTDVGLGPSFPWNTYDDLSAPFQWSRPIAATTSTHLYRMNFFRTPGGNWICYAVSGVPTCRALPTLGISGTSIPVSDYLATRTLIAANTAALMCDSRYASCAVANIGYCNSATAFGCEIACANGLDDDGDGLTDGGDPNCSP